ncbi:MAG: carboxy-S-adenosyl-L-methionine synthase CmoA [Gammaproteobacteria bacterium]|nr:carboxy-S-adenosyl-L-methionine synthase CmoA [Gammaproteobacteria bacterium]
MDSERDRIYARQQQAVADFSFDEAVVNVFPDMIRRSVPGYGTLLALVGVIAAEYAQADSRCYDLGCSVGATTLALRRHIRRPGCTIVAVDNSAAMLDVCRTNIANDDSPLTVELLCADIRELVIEDASVVVLNYTLQFVEPQLRSELIRRIYNGMRAGGVLVLSEKVCFDDQPWQDRAIALHHAFKRANGYSDLEISQKRAALERVLVPETEDIHLRRLTAAGFSMAETWFQCLNFMSILAIK